MFNVLKITIPHGLFGSWACIWQRKQQPAIPSCPGVEAPFLLKSRAAYLLLLRYDPMESPLLTAPLTKLRGAEEFLVVVMGTTCQQAPQRCDVTQVTEYLSWLGPFSGQSHTSQPSLGSNMNTEQKHLELSG